MVNILLEAKADIQLTDSKGRTALHDAAEGNHKAICQLLLAAGADPNEPDLSGMTALHVACTQNWQGIVELFIAHGGDALLETVVKFLKVIELSNF